MGNTYVHVEDKDIMLKYYIKTAVCTLYVGKDCKRNAQLYNNYLYVRSKETANSINSLEIAYICKIFDR